MKARVSAAAGLGQRVYLAAVSAGGVLVLLLSVPFAPYQDWQLLLLLAVLCGIAHNMRVSLFRSSAVSVSAAVVFTGLVLLGPVAAIWIQMGTSIVSVFRPKRKPFKKAIFNLGNHVLSAGVAGVIYAGVGGTVLPEAPITVLAPVLLAAAGYFVVQTGLIAGVIAITEQTSFVKTWDTNFKWSTPNFIALSVIGLGMAAAKIYMDLPGIALFSIPLVMAWYSFKLYMMMSREVRNQNDALKITNDKLEGSYVSTIRALAAAVDAKDHYTHGHSEMTMEYAVAIATELGMNEDEIRGVQIAALLHDVGKIGIPDSILNKPDGLTEDEWGVVRGHPELGAKVIQQVDLLATEVDAVLHHHEHYDGTGYPHGLKGDEIALPAQIIGVADAFQAMTSNRPYRSAFDDNYALTELKRCSGTQFNPRVVDAMERASATLRSQKQVHLPALPWNYRPKQTPVPVDSN